MRSIASTLTVIISLFVFTTANAQVLNQSKLLKLLPPIPGNLLTATQEEVSSFQSKIDSISNLFSNYEDNYKRNRSPDDMINNNEIMEYYDSRDRIQELHSIQRDKYNDLYNMFEALDSELFAKNDSIQEIINQLKYYNKDTSVEESELSRQIYNNKVAYGEKKSALFIKFLNDYRAELDNIEELSNKTETIALPDHLNKNISYVLMNVNRYLVYFSQIYQFNVGAFVPAGELGAN